MDRPSWDNFFISQAFLWSTRSHDIQTQCGCVLVDRDNTILSGGYNGHIRGITEGVLPVTRESTLDFPNGKYSFMIHAEHNAILNCARQGKSTTGAKAYITNEPCLSCLQYLWQAGIKDIVYSSINKAFMTASDDTYKTHFNLLVSLTGINVSEVNISIEHVEDLVKKIKKQQM